MPWSDCLKEMLHFSFTCWLQTENVYPQFSVAQYLLQLIDKVLKECTQESHRIPFFRLKILQDLFFWCRSIKDGWQFFWTCDETKTIKGPSVWIDWKSCQLVIILVQKLFVPPNAFQFGSILGLPPHFCVTFGLILAPWHIFVWQQGGY